MPLFLDHHEAPKGLTPEMLAQMAADVKAGKVDQFGVKGINSFIGENDAWCLTEAPSADVVHKAHEVGYGLNMTKGSVVAVKPLV